MSDLLSGQNTPKVERLVNKAAARKFPRVRRNVFFEHGHWWLRLIHKDDDQTFDVVDAEPSIANTGLDFEEL